ncbi:MAG: hypothetical protein SV062_07220 [Thermodesulfobacteriota bacterium]|nr:hypothetical protein [Thermodesulfobacteriota bacterium]
MPIKYNVSPDGHFIHAIANGIITPKEFIEFEVAHGSDKRLKPPVNELLEIEYGACRNINKDDISKVLQRRKEIKDPPTPHRCAIVVSYGDAQSWDIASFYEGMVIVHYPETVIVFGDSRIARTWLGVAETDSMDI